MRYSDSDDGPNPYLVSQCVDYYETVLVTPILMVMKLRIPTTFLIITKLMLVHLMHVTSTQL